MGLANRELPAWVEQIPKAILSAMPVDSLHSKFLSGFIPKKGWGLGGDTGGGKTMANAAWLRQHIKAQVERAASLKEGYELKGSYVWCSWPDEVNELRRHATDDSTEQRIEELISCDLLILDDLGRERIRGSYTEDWVASQLDTIINHRYRDVKPILWTTNITEPALLDLYGAAMLSRLTGDNPLIWVDNLPDLRG